MPPPGGGGLLTVQAPSVCLCPASLLHYELLPPPPAWLSAGVDRVLLLLLPPGVSGLLPVRVNNDGLLPPPVFGHDTRLLVWNWRRKVLCFPALTVPVVMAFTL